MSTRLPLTHEALESLPLLRGLDAGVLAQAQLHVAPAGHRLFGYGEKPRWMHLVLAGEAVAQRGTEGGAAVTLKVARAGDLLAESSLTQRAYDCDGVCRSECRILQLPVAALRRSIDEDAGTRWWWIELLARQARRQRLRAERLAMKSIHDRLHHLVVTDGDAGGCLHWPGTRKMLAAELGVRPEALIRALADLEGRGVVRVQGKRSMCWVDASSLPCDAAARSRSLT